jgi:molybdopterin synthase sulfur carrier subunit
MAKVFVSYALRKYTGGNGQVEMPGKTLGVLIDNLDAAFPGISKHLLQDGRLKPGLAAVCGHAATRQGLLQKLDDDTEVHFVPAVSGGQEK